MYDVKIWVSKTFFELIKAQKSTHPGCPSVTQIEFDSEGEKKNIKNEMHEFLFIDVKLRDTKLKF